MNPNGYRRCSGSSVSQSGRARPWHLLVVAAVCWSTLACQPTPARPPASVSQAAVEADIQKVQSVVARVAHHVDGKRWPELQALFANEVETDYTSLFGGQIQKQRSDELVMGAWKTVLGPLDSTQHVLGPIDVRLQAGRAIAECHFRAYHRSARAQGGPEWLVAGHYIFELVKTGSDWKIQKLVLQTFYQTGNAKLLQEAGAK